MANLLYQRYIGQYLANRSDQYRGALDKTFLGEDQNQVNLSSYRPTDGLGLINSLSPSSTQEYRPRVSVDRIFS